VQSSQFFALSFLTSLRFNSSDSQSEVPTTSNLFSQRPHRLLLPSDQRRVRLRFVEKFNSNDVLDLVGCSDDSSESVHGCDLVGLGGGTVEEVGRVGGSTVKAMEEERSKRPTRWKRKNRRERERETDLCSSGFCLPLAA